MSTYPLVARYNIKSEVHRGSNSTLYLAHAPAALPCALKVFAVKEGHGVDRRSPSRFFLRELEVLCTADHPNLVRLLGFGSTTDSGAEFLLLEWLNGEDFVSASKKATRRDFYAMLAQACRAMDYLHHRGLVHGDLKPSNLLVIPNPSPAPDPESPVVKLIDFGCTTPLGANSGTVVHGSPLYLAPEVIQGAAPTFASDLYSFGVIIYECLTGQTPFAGETIGAILKQHIQEAPPPIYGEMLRELHSLVQQLLSKEPTRRPSSAAAVLRQINSVSEEGQFPLHTCETWRARIGSCPAPARARWDATCRQFLTESLGGTIVQPGVVLIIGDKGSGKTRLLRELGLYAIQLGFTVDLRSAPSIEDLQDLTALTQHDRAVFGTSSPVAICYDDIPPDAVTPLACQLETASHFLSPVVVMLSLDSSGLAGDVPTSLIERLSKCGRLLTLVLQPFDQSDLHCVLQSALGDKTIHPGVVEFLYRESGGKPGILADVSAATLINSGTTLEREEVYVQRDHSILPPSHPLAHHLQERLGRLSHDERSVTVLLAQAAVSLGPPDIANLCTLSLPLVEAICDKLTLNGILRHCSTNPPLFSAPSQFVNRILLESIPSSQRNSLHRQIAEWYLASADTDEHLALVVTHYSAAGMHADTLRHSMVAAQRADIRRDYPSAAKYYALAVESCPADGALRTSAQLGLARAHFRLGRFSDALRTLDALDSQGSVPSDIRCELEITRSYIATLSGDFLLAEMAARASLTLALFARITGRGTEAMYQLGSVLCSLGRRNEGLPLLYRAMSRSRSSGLRMGVEDCLLRLAQCHWERGHYLRALRFQRRCLALQKHIMLNKPTLVSTNVAILQSDLGNYVQARRNHRCSLQLAQGREAHALRGLILNNIGETYRAQGRWAHALRNYENGSKALSGSGAGVTLLTLDYNRAHVLMSTGYYSASISYLKHRSGRLHAMHATQGACEVYSTWGALLLATGRFDLGKRVIAHASEMARISELSALILELATMYSLLTCALGRSREAHTSISTAIRDHDNRSPFNVRLSAHLTELQIDRVLGLSPEAFDERLKPILDKARKKKMAWHTTWALTMRGETLLEAGRSDEAEKDLTEAIKIAQKNADRPQFWKASYWLGRVFEQRLQYERALGSYRVAALTVNELAMDIDDDRYREPFLAQPEVREVQARFERLRAEVGRKARHDIAAMSRSEKISRRMLNALNAIGQKLTSILDLDDLLTHLLDLSIENVRAERGMVFLRDDATGEMRLACARNMDKESLDEVSSFSRSVIKRVAEGHTLLEVDVGKDPALSAFQSLVIHEIKSILCVPMRTRGRTVGVIYLDTRRAAQMFTDKERTFVESFASQAAIAIENARVFGDINAENARLKREAAGRGRFENLIGTSAAMMRLSDTIAGVMGSDCNVLVAGESGTGKELVAKAIHYNGPRQKRKFVAIDCGALPESLLEAELFGFTRGAFTGADRDKVGLIEESHGGTLFLDEITNTTVALQAKLLRVLQEHEVRRLGENSTRRVDARIIAATNADIAALIRDGRFRSDLYYRLNVVTIEVPPLRDRREDIPLLVEHFVRQRSPDDASRRRLAPGVVEALGRYDWPGNVRELENVMERLLVLARGPIISQDALPESIRVAAGLVDVAAVARNAALDGGNNGPYPGINGQKTGEQMMVEDALRRFGGDKAKAARFIGWNRQKLYRKIKGFGIPSDYGRTV